MDQLRDPPAPITMNDVVKRVGRLRRDSPASDPLSWVPLGTPLRGIVNLGGLGVREAEAREPLAESQPAVTALQSLRDRARNCR